jgi:hypothetical protein
MVTPAARYGKERGGGTFIPLPLVCVSSERRRTRGDRLVGRPARSALYLNLKSAVRVVPSLNVKLSTRQVPAHVFSVFQT